MYSKQYLTILLDCAELLGCVILDLPIRIIYFQSTLISLPDSTLKVLAILIAYWVYNIRGIWGKIAVSVLAFALCIWMSYYGYDIWIYKLNYDSFKDKVKEVVQSPLIFQNIEGQDVSIESFKGKYVALDFWSSTCGVCFRKFPQVQELYEQLKVKPNAELYSVFCRMTNRGETAKMGADILHKRGFSFPAISIDMDEPVLKEIGVDGFPTVLIIDPEGKIVFRGNIDTAAKYLERIYN